MNIVRKKLNSLLIFIGMCWIFPSQAQQLFVKQGHLVTGIGNKNFDVLYFDIVDSTATSFSSAKINLNGTTRLSDLKNLRVYRLSSPNKFNYLTDSLVAKGRITPGDFNLKLNRPMNLKKGKNYFCLVADIASTAKEGNLVDAEIVSVSMSPEKILKATQPVPNHSATIFLSQATLFSPGDYGAVSYRIPSIVTAKDGSLVTSTDKRNNHSGDLPSNIDQYIRRSTNKGKTWSAPLMICGEGTELGYGDPAMVVERESGKVIQLVNYDQGIFTSTAEKPCRILLLESTDNGKTFSAPVDITNQLYGAGCNNEATKKWAGMFISSGRGLQLRNGRLLFAGVVRDGAHRALQVHAVYSDDKGKTWQISPNSALDGGDESKFTELTNGDVMVSIRRAPKRFTNISTDQGISWQKAAPNNDLKDPACNGEIVSYTSVPDGFNKNRMLQSLCDASNRTNVSMLLSYDDGKTFPVRKTICAGSSAYSTFTILPDGTIGMYFEDGTTNQCYDMQFVRFSLKWLTNGVDQYIAPSTKSKKR